MDGGKKIQPIFRNVNDQIKNIGQISRKINEVDQMKMIFYLLTLNYFFCNVFLFAEMIFFRKSATIKCVRWAEKTHVFIW